MTKNAFSPKVSQFYEAGAILESSWGYEQTNIDFYVILNINPESGYCKVLPLEKISSPLSEGMTRQNTPGEIDFSEKPTKKKIKKSGSGQMIGFSMGNGWCSLWDGKPATSSHYA
jgi:hypothetical protein